jgi:membrane associated rhomboid family serine protease
LILAAGGSIGTHIFLNFSDLNPIVGASGIVSALMGAYLYRFPNAKLLVLVPFGIIFPTTIKAKYFMAFWFISQVLIALQNNNISWEAHIGGFIVGYISMALLNNR